MDHKADTPETLVTVPKDWTLAQTLLQLWLHTEYVGYNANMGAKTSVPQLEQAALVFRADKQDTSVDYWMGKPIKTSFKTFPQLDLRLYKRDAQVSRWKELIAKIHTEQS